MIGSFFLNYITILDPTVSTKGKKKRKEKEEPTKLVEATNHMANKYESVGYFSRPGLEEGLVISIYVTLCVENKTF